jgi:predicted nucleic acid-binding protein
VSLYLDSSAILAALLDQPEGAAARATMLADADWYTARHTLVEVRRNLARLLAPEDLGPAREAFHADWSRMHVIELDEVTCADAVRIAEETGARTLDALHLAAALRLGGGELRVLTFDRHQARAAQALGQAVTDPGG